jgi:hypothetical protein
VRLTFHSADRCPKPSRAQRPNAKQGLSYKIRLKERDFDFSDPGWESPKVDFGTQSLKGKRGIEGNERHAHDGHFLRARSAMALKGVQSRVAPATTAAVTLPASLVRRLPDAATPEKRARERTLLLDPLPCQGNSTNGSKKEHAAFVVIGRVFSCLLGSARRRPIDSAIAFWRSTSAAS